ncbi:MAG TPA: hypothetical protein PK198_27185, partial [Saprospiraceae bacterium]|nr:hypothetical protein [Saprospiraceae bacterium]
VASCSKEQVVEQSANAEQPLSRQEINAFIEQSIQHTNDVFRWENADLKLLWSAGVRSDSVFALGYQLPGEEDLKTRFHLIDPQSGAWAELRNRL